jgi:alginate O-acetyltransferase complex protein AlgI
VVWGALHGLLYLAYVAVWPASRRMAALTPGGDTFVPSLRAVGEMLLTFSLTCLAWVFFRAVSVSDGVTILKKIVVDVATTRPAFLYKQAAIWIVLLLAIEWVQRHHANPLHIDRFPRALRWSFYYAVAAAIFLFAPIHYTPFIYFQF